MKLSEELGIAYCEGHGIVIPKLVQKIAELEEKHKQEIADLWMNYHVSNRVCEKLDISINQKEYDMQVSWKDVIEQHSYWKKYDQELKGSKDEKSK